jgi:hypothetical protein
MTKAVTIYETIESMPIDMDKPLNNDVKTQIVKIVEREFDNKESVYHEQERFEEAKILEAYRKEVGFDKLLKAIRDAEHKLDIARKALSDVGLMPNGEAEQKSHYDSKKNCWVNKPKADRLYELMQAIKRNAPSQTLKAKLISRIWLASKYGEVVVILNQVLGNGIIPTVLKKKK